MARHEVVAGGPAQRPCSVAWTTTRTTFYVHAPCRAYTQVCTSELHERQAVARPGTQYSTVSGSRPQRRGQWRLRADDRAGGRA
jgi:hypothetical protein